jgi:serine/threonine-protein kinase RIM15
MISPEAKDLILQLLNVDFANRLGANGADEIKAHAFF